MKKIISGILILFFMATIDYAQESKISLQLTIKSDNGIWLTMKSPYPGFPDPIRKMESSKILFDGKEYSQKQQNGFRHGSESYFQNSWIDNIQLLLSGYDITKDMMTSGKHSIAIKIGDVVSNSLNIEIVESQLLKMTIKPYKPVYLTEENIEFLLTVKNLDFVTLDIFQLIDSSKVILDGKEYATTGPGAWGGPTAIEPGSNMSAGVSLSYDVAKDRLTTGEHKMTVKINASISNTITIEVVKNYQDKPIREKDLGWLSDVHCPCKCCKPSWLK